MEHNNLLFSTTFLITLSVLLFFLGTSDTGMFSATEQCEHGICRQTCRFDSDCEAGQACCDSDGTGVCESYLPCDKPYKYDVESDIRSDYREVKNHLDSPGFVIDDEKSLYLALLIVAVLFAIFYIINQRSFIENKRKKIERAMKHTASFRRPEIVTAKKTRSKEVSETAENNTKKRAKKTKVAKRKTATKTARKVKKKAVKKTAKKTAKKTRAAKRTSRKKTKKIAKTAKRANSKTITKKTVRKVKKKTVKKRAKKTTTAKRKTAARKASGKRS